MVEHLSIIIQARDSVLLKNKTEAIQKIVNQHTTHTIFTINPAIIENTLAILTEKVDEWDGVCLCRISTFTNYNDFFNMAKQWWVNNGSVCSTKLSRCVQYALF